MTVISLKKINDPHFKDLNKISDNTFEVFSSKRKIKMDVPIQVGCLCQVVVGK